MARSGSAYLLYTLFTGRHKSGMREFTEDKGLCRKNAAITVSSQNDVSSGYSCQWRE